MLKRLPGWYWTILLSVFSLGFGLLAPSWLSNQATPEPEVIIVAQNATATETLLPATPYSTQTATLTLLPPPTIEPPTATPAASNTPTMTPSQSFIVNVTVEGIQGLPSPTVESLEACEPRDDWKLEHEVQTNETLSMIADYFGTTIRALAEGNCLEDVNVIRVGQFLHVPGDAFPVVPAVECTEYTLLQPIDDAWDIPATGQIIFNWRGPRAPRNLVRIYPPDYDFSEHNPDKYFDYAFDLRQNEAIDLIELEAGGTWFWQVFPLDSNFVQVCPESPRWSFNKNPLNDE
jgi:LysM repeat protein